MPANIGDDGKERGSGDAKPQLRASKVISYEDLLVAQYLDEIEKAPPFTKKGHKEPISPYAQPLAHTNLLLSQAQVRGLVHNKQYFRASNRARPKSASNRPLSAYSQNTNSYRPKSAASHATTNGTLGSTGKPKIDPKFIADPTKWDPATPRTEESKKMRPVSAPVGKPRRPLSAYYTKSARPASAKSSMSGLGKKKYKPLYKKQPNIIVVTAYKNGSRDKFVRAAAPTIPSLLQFCTEKLELPHAGRRLFLSNGKEVKDEKEIQRDAEVFISMGENFKNPLKPALRNSHLKAGVTWTMNGLVLPEEGRKKATKPKLSKRFDEASQRKTVRIMTLRNGKSTDGIDVIANPAKWSEYLDFCTIKLDLGSPARIIYDWDGNECNCLTDVPVMEGCLQSTPSSPVYGPVWVSKGEGFSPTGAKNFVGNVMRFVKERIAEAENYREQLNLCKDEKKDQVKILAILSMSDEEIYEALDLADTTIDENKEALKILRKQFKQLSTMVQEQEVQGNSYQLHHIKEVDINDRLVGVQGIRLRVYENGTDTNPILTYFNLKDGSKGVGGDKDKIFERFLDHLSNACKAFKGEANPRGALARRIFDSNGREIEDFFQLENEQSIWLSFGEGFKCPFVLAMQVNFDRASAYIIETENEGIRDSRQVAIREQLMSEDVMKGARDRHMAWRAVASIPEEYEPKVLDENADPVLRGTVEESLQNFAIDPNSHFLQCKEEERFLLYPELSVGMKQKKGAKSIWPPEALPY